MTKDELIDNITKECRPIIEQLDLEPKVVEEVLDSIYSRVRTEVDIFCKGFVEDLSKVIGELED